MNLGVGRGTSIHEIGEATAAPRSGFEGVVGADTREGGRSSASEWTEMSRYA